MRELVIKNLRLVVDARRSDATSETYYVVELINQTIGKVDGGPVLLFERTVSAEYRDTDESSQ